MQAANGRNEGASDIAEHAGGAEAACGVRATGPGTACGTEGASSTRVIRLEDSALAQPGITILVGHAGVGKTNLALNLALSQAHAGRDVTLADLDLVNPYFRSSDYDGSLGAAGVRLVAPTFARTGLDTPSLGGDLRGAIQQAGADARADGDPNTLSWDCVKPPTCGNTTFPQVDDGAVNCTIPRNSAPTPAPGPRLIIDVGGDDGAIALGRYAAELAAGRARMFFVVNAFRNLTATPEEALEVLAAVEGSARMRACGIVNCSNLAGQTRPEHVAHGRAYARQLAGLAGLPLVLTVAPEQLAEELADAAACGPEPFAFARRIVRPPWE